MNNKLELKEHSNFLTQRNLEFINQIVLSKDFPFFIQNFDPIDEKNLYKSKNIFLSHTVQKRLETCSLKEAINSPYYEESVDILNNFCKAINQKVMFYTRINYNLTFNNGNKQSHIHRDHDGFDHKQIIIYLNDCDKNATTCIVNENEKLIKEIEPKKYKGICFNSLKHYQKFPKKNHRVILVATFI